MRKVQRLVNVVDNEASDRKKNRDPKSIAPTPKCGINKEKRGNEEAMSFLY